jgi:hypothetical protein
MNDDGLQKLCTEHPDALNERVQGGMNPAHLAARLNYTNAIRILFNTTPTLFDGVRPGGITPAIEAAAANSVEALDMIAKLSPKTLDVKLQSGGGIAHFSAYSDSMETIVFLAHKSLSLLKVVSSDGEVPAHVAVIANSIDTLAAIQELAPETMNVADKKGRTPLALATELGRSDCIAVLSTKTKPSSIAEPSPYAEVQATASAVRLARRWSSRALPQADVQAGEFTEAEWNTSRTTGGYRYWDQLDRHPKFRLMFFTSKQHPLSDISSVKPSAAEKQFAFWGGSLTDNALCFLAVAGIAPQISEREAMSVWLRAGGRKNDLFTTNPPVRLFMTFSSFEEQIRRAGGIPIRFVTPADIRKAP